MPIFEYRCGSCSSVFEQLVKSSTSDEEIRCEKCDSRDVERLLSVFGVTTADSAKSSKQPPAGPCGSSCACFPQ